jgi:NitT/TauT family transport system substrate-binding protein
LAKSLGYFRDEGFDVVLHESANLEANQMSVELAEGVRTVRSPMSAMELKKKKYFMGAVCPLGFHDALAKGMPLVQIGGLLANPNTLIMRKELAESLRKNLSAFKDLTIALNKNGPSAIDYTALFTNQLKANHVPYKTRWYTSFAETAEAVGRGEVAAALSTPPYDQEFVEKHPELTVFELRALYSRLPCCRQLVTREQLRDKKTRAKYVRFERAIIRAHKYYSEHKLETSEIVAKILKLNPATVRSIFSRPGYSLDPNPNLKGTMAFYNTLKGQIGKQEVQEAVDTSVYEEALLSLASATPADPYYKSAVREYRQTN